ncbi:MAG: DUF1080 domain-containing protein [Planctomycetaceae bacterium]
MPAPRLLLALLCLAPLPLSAAEPNTLTPDEQQAGWRLLFDGKTTHGWRNFKQPAASPGWKVEDGALVRSANGAGDIMTADEFGAFELVLEYKIAPGGNSGLMFHVTEEGATPWQTGPEVQILDNAGGHDPNKAGWLYQLYVPDLDATKPAGEWNEIRLVVTPEKGETWMNGRKYYDFVKGSADWNARVAKSKFAAMPLFGKATMGHICLQDHGDAVAFRSIRIRPLDAPPTKPTPAP